MPEEKIIKIVDTTVHTRGASIEQVGGQGALIVKDINTPTPENASLALTYNIDGELITITKTVDGTDYEKTLTWADGKVINLSEWVQL